MSRSSIFSFKTLLFRESRPAGMLRAIVLAVVVFGVAEVASRACLGPLGRAWEYWDPKAAVRWEAYQETDSEDGPELLFVGDSTSMTNFEAAELQDHLTSVNGITCLGWPGNYALSFEKSTLPVLTDRTHPPRVVAASLLPTAFVDRTQPWATESSITASPFCQRSDGKWLLEDWLYLARWRRSVASMLYDGDDETRNGFEPPEGTDADDAGAPQVYKFATVELSEDRFKVLERTADVVNKSGAVFVVVIPPYSGDLEQRKIVAASYRSRLTEREAQGRWRVFDVQKECDPQAEHFYDYGHLNAKGAKHVSRIFAAWLERTLSEPKETVGSNSQALSRLR